jgi:hypothetical protein
MTVYDDITDEMLEHVIKSDGLVSTPFYKDICAELLQRRQADRKWKLGSDTPIWLAYKIYGSTKYVVKLTTLGGIANNDYWMPALANDSQPKPPEVSQ